MSFRARLTAALLALLLGGCAGFKPIAEPAPATRSAAGAGAQASTASLPASPPPTAKGSAVVVTVQAPDEVRTLLQKYLDVIRLGSLADEEVDAAEWNRLINASPQQVRDLLQTEGYFDPEIELQRQPGPPPDAPEPVVLKVDPGVRAKVHKLTLEVEGELERSASAADPDALKTLSQWRRDWRLPEGRDFRNPDWSGAKANALAALRAEGYATANWLGTAADVDVANSQVRLFLVADSGPLFRLGRLQVEGLVAHDGETVNNLLGARPGTPLSESWLLDFQERLLKSGLFAVAAVTLDLDPEQAASATVLTLVRESPLQAYTLGLGFSVDNGPRASVEHLYRRVFGYAASARNKIEIGQKRQFYDGEISTHPLQGMHRYLLGLVFERQKTDSDTVISQRLRVGRSQDRQSLERLHFLEVERSETVTITGAVSNATAVSANFHGNWRDLDSLILPTRGLSLALQLGVGQSTSSTGRNGPFVRTFGRLTGYLPLGNDWYGQAHVELGRVFVATDVAVPESQKWRAGGDNSVRGYAYRSLGPLQDGVVAGGTALATAGVEVARPISRNLPSLWGAAFVDVGNAANSLGGLKPVLGYGVGVRWRSPAGPLRLDIGWGQETKQFRLHFSVGVTF